MLDSLQLDVNLLVCLGLLVCRLACLQLLLHVDLDMGFEFFALLTVGFFAAIGCHSLSALPGLMFIPLKTNDESY